jgi:hypothetical protein
MLAYGFLVDHGSKRIVRQQLDLSDLVRGAKAVEEMEERNPRLQRRSLREFAPLLFTK